MSVEHERVGRGQLQLLLSISSFDLALQLRTRTQKLLETYSLNGSVIGTAPMLYTP